MLFNDASQHIIGLIENSENLYYIQDLVPIVEELHCTAIDHYTFQKELEYFFYSITSKILLKECYTYKNKINFLTDVQWYLVAEYYLRKHANNCDIKFSRTLSSYFYKKHIKDDNVLDSGRYKFEKEISPSKTYWISLRPTSDFLLK